MFCALYLDGDPIEHVEESARVSLEFASDSGVTHRCSACGADLIETSDGFQTDAGDTDCAAHDPYDDPNHSPADDDGPADDGPAVGTGPHSPEPIPLSWVNSAAIDTDEKDDSVTVSISVGDPRGAFSFTVRRLPDGADCEIAGRLIMHVPYPGEPLPHERLTEQRPGTYLIG